MSKYILNRVLTALVTVWIVTSLAWVMIQAIPGDPFTNEKRVVPATRAAMKAYYGLDKPLVVQYAIYMGRVLQGNLGYSFIYKTTTVNQIIARSFPVSADLGLKAIVVGFSGGIFLGILAALNHNKFWDRFSIFIAIIGVSIPAFVIAALLQYFIGVKLDLLPVAQWKGLEYQIMPVFALALGMVAQVARYMRSQMLDVIGQDYVKTAKAKGLSQIAIVVNHEIRNAILPIITILGPWIAFIITGTFVIESIFAIPGLGKFYVNAIATQDFTVVSGLTAFIGTILVFATLIVDVLYGIIDPRIRIDGSSK